MSKPVRLNPAAVVTATAAGVFIHSDLGTFQASGADIGAFVDALLPLLNGSHSEDEITERLPSYSKDSVLQLLTLLRSRGVIQEVPAETQSAQGPAEFYRAWKLDPQIVAEELHNTHVTVAGLDPWGVTVCVYLAAAGVRHIELRDDDAAVSADDLAGNPIWRRESAGRSRASELAARLQENYPGCEVTTTGLLAQPSDLCKLIVSCLRGDDLQPLMTLAKAAHKGNIPTLYGTLEDFTAVAGPLVIPGQTPCWNCTRLRLLANDPRPETSHALQIALLKERAPQRVSSYLAPMAPLLGQMLAIEAVRFLSKYSASTLTGHQLVQDLISLESRRHAILRMPWCEVCGGAKASVKSEEPVGGKGGPSLGETNDPDEIRKLLRGVVDERTGVIQRVAMHPAEAEDPELPVTCSAVLCHYTDGHFHQREQEIGSGKGLSPARAMVGSIGEAVERYSAARHRKIDMRRAAMNRLDGEYIDPRSLALYTSDRYGDPEFPFRPYDPEQPIEWVLGRWLDGRGNVWLPALPVYFNFHVPMEERFCQVSSNGLAAGPDTEDAGWRAAFELLERDTFMLSWLAKRPGKKILLDETLSDDTREVIRQMERTGASIECFALDVAYGIPVVTCLGWGDGERWPGVTVSSASHSSWSVAVEKAILEQGHVGPYLRRLSKESKTKIPGDVSEVRSLIDHALYYVNPERARELNFLGTGGDISLSELKQTNELSKGECNERLKQAGLRLAVADVTSPDLLDTPFRVARALGENIQQIDFGYYARRLGNPRLLDLLGGNEPNPLPHPIA